MAEPHVSQPPGTFDFRATSAKVSQLFTPAAPISQDALFAGRQEQFSQVIDAINQPGQHAILFGARGVGKTSLANVLAARITSTNPAVPVLAPRINCDVRRMTYAEH